MNQTSPFPAGTPVVAYLRDSGGNEQDLSIPQQERALQDWCNQNQLTLTRSFVDKAVSGGSTVKRVQFHNMLNYFHHRSPPPPEKAILVWSFSRFARNFDDSQFYKADLRRLGFEIFSLNDANMEGLNGRLIEAILDWMHAKYREELAVNITRGVNDSIVSFGTLGGLPPRGFIRESVIISIRRDGTPHTASRWVPDPLTWDLCRSIWDQRLQGKSLREIHRDNPGFYKTFSCYSTFFDNPIYKGNLQFGDQLIREYCPALVSEEEWETVQNMSFHLGDKLHRRKLPRSDSAYALSGLLVCGRCNGSIVGHTVISKGTTYHYYQCSNAKNNKTCDLPPIERDVLNGFVLERLKLLASDPSYMDRMVDEINEAYEDLVKETGSNPASSQVKIAAIKTRVDHLYKAIEETGHTPRMLERINELERELDLLDAISSSTQIRIDKKSVALAMQGIYQRLIDAIEENNPAEVNRIIHIFCDKIIVDIRDGFYEVDLFYKLPDRENAVLPVVRSSPGALLILYPLGKGVVLVVCQDRGIPFCVTLKNIK